MTWQYGFELRKLEAEAEDDGTGNQQTMVIKPTSDDFYYIVYSENGKSYASETVPGESLLNHMAQFQPNLFAWKFAYNTS